jgi:hypothetical protein
MFIQNISYYDKQRHHPVLSTNFLTGSALGHSERRKKLAHLEGESKFFSFRFPPAV